MVAKPPVVASGETVEAQWGVDTIDFAHSRWAFVRNPQSDIWMMEDGPAITEDAYLELTQLPANDPNIVAAEVAMLHRSVDASNFSNHTKHYHPTLPAPNSAGLKYSTGTTLGGSSGAHTVKVGGKNNREIVVQFDSPKNWVRILGWWVAGPKPPYPVDADPIVAGWGESLTKWAGEKWEYIPVPGASGYLIYNGDGIGTARNRIVIPQIPANDPDIVAVSVQTRILDRSGAANLNVVIRDGDAGELIAGVSYTSGVEAKGGMTGPFIVLVGGPANNEIIHTTSEGGANVGETIWCLGYWKRQKADSPNLPPLPVESGVISSAWGNALNDLTEKKLRFVDLPLLTALNGVDGVLSPGAALELTNLPLNDPNVIAAKISIMLRDNNGTGNLMMQASHFDGTLAGTAYTEGVQSKGGSNGPFYVKVGGTNNRQIKWHTSEAGSAVDCYLYCHGYWTK